MENDPHAVSVHKKNPIDFALWKAAKPEEPYWEAPWGKGRPGWHIECSTIARWISDIILSLVSSIFEKIVCSVRSEYFGDSIDIHSGGFDLMFPHHQNEDKQCCAYHDVDQWVSYWLHTGNIYDPCLCLFCAMYVNADRWFIGFLHLSEQTEKMSKSLQNTVSVREFLRTYSPNHLRMMCFATHYRGSMCIFVNCVLTCIKQLNAKNVCVTDIEYNKELLDKCIKRCAKFYNFFEDCLAYISGYSTKGNIDSSKLLQVW